MVKSSDWQTQNHQWVFLLLLTRSPNSLRSSEATLLFKHLYFQTLVQTRHRTPKERCYKFERSERIPYWFPPTDILFISLSEGQPPWVYIQFPNTNHEWLDLIEDFTTWRNSHSAKGKEASGGGGGNAVEGWGTGQIMVHSNTQTLSKLSTGMTAAPVSLLLLGSFHLKQRLLYSPVWQPRGEAECNQQTPIIQKGFIKKSHCQAKVWNESHFGSAGIWYDLAMSHKTKQIVFVYQSTQAPFPATLKVSWNHFHTSMDKPLPDVNRLVAVALFNDNTSDI